MMGIYGSERKRAAIIFILYLICYVAFLGVNGMTAPSEIRYGEIPREMLAADDWVSPRLNGVRYFEKPVLGYWLGAASIGIFGENNFAVRLPSALAAGLMALAIYLFIGRAGANPREIPDGLSRADELAALIFLSSFGVFAMGSTAVLDSVFSFFITAFMILFFLMSEPGLAKKEKICLGALSGFFCACAFLTKGFLAVALPFAAIVPYSVWTGGHRNFPRDILLPMTVAVLAVLPWGVLIHLREPDFWRFFFWNEHVRRFLSDNAQHARSFWFFFAAAPLMALPWSFLTPSAFAGVISIYNYGGRLGRAVKFCVCWLVFPFLFLSMSRGKLFSYILPCFPPFAMLVALGLSRPAALSGKWRGRLFKWGLLANLIFFSALMILFLYLQFIGKNQPVYAQKWKAVMILNSFIFFAMCG
ncbi:MAG: phospholipid carrier-dependent glycosyltransferase, partial [Synergistaceae bacterium]|nr:phospholipid carrier-dependent glycosyltransferase [Synergistaceae bacterium]